MLKFVSVAMSRRDAVGDVHEHKIVHGGQWNSPEFKWSCHPPEFNA